jgi:Rrf2 family protein
MRLSRKSQYALRAVHELALRGDQEPSRIADIAEAQGIPHRFLEAILNQLRQGGLVESRRGPGGGYLLAIPPEDLTVGQVIRCVEGPLGPVECVAEDASCPAGRSCAFRTMWQRARDAMLGVFDTTTLADIRAEDIRLRGTDSWSYAI